MMVIFRISDVVAQLFRVGPVLSSLVLLFEGVAEKSNAENDGTGPTLMYSSYFDFEI